MPEEVLEEATEVAESPKGSSLGLVIAILAFVAAVAAVALNVLMKPDTSALEARVQAVESSVQINTDNIVALKDAQTAMDEQIKEEAPKGIVLATSPGMEFALRGDEACSGREYTISDAQIENENDFNLSVDNEDLGIVYIQSVDDHALNPPKAQGVAFSDSEQVVSYYFTEAAAMKPVPDTANEFEETGCEIWIAEN